MAKKGKRLSDVDVAEGSLRKMGWPDSSKLVAAAHRDRKKVTSKLVWLMNITPHANVKAKCRSILNRIKKELGD